jgi:MoaA/NifB/PqqE/SkfB family radical SAM enzyme
MINRDNIWLRRFARLPEVIKRDGISWNLRKGAWRVLHRPVRLHSNPVIDGGIYIAVTTYCDLKCPGCYRTINLKKNRWKNRYMSVSAFRQVVEGFPTTEAALLCGIGEPVLHPSLPELIRIAKQSKKFNSIVLTTNLMARDDEYYLQLFHEGLSKMYVSVDALTPALAEKVRTGTVTEKLKDRLRFLSSRINRIASPYFGGISIRVAVGSENYGSVESILRELNQLGEFAVSVNYFDDYGGDGPQKTPSIPEIKELIHRVNSIKPSLHNLTVVTSPPPKAYRCRALVRGDVHVTVDGYATTCTVLWNKEYYNTNLISTPLSEFLRTSELKMKRQQFQREYPSFCNGCKWRL